MKKKLLITILAVGAVSLMGCQTTQEEAAPSGDVSANEAVSDNATESETISEDAAEAEETSDSAENEEPEVEYYPLPVSQTGRYEEETDNLLPIYSYELKGAHEVDGRQGIAWEDGSYYVSGSTTLSKYDENWSLVASADDPFAGFTDEVNHIGDIDVYNGEIYAGVEYFMDGEAKNIQIAVYDAETFEVLRTYSFDESSGQNEVSGIAVDPDLNVVWMCSWADSESGRYLYKYDLESGEYLGKLHLQAPPQWIQGIAYYGGSIYITADDGTADEGEPDHVYRVDLADTDTAGYVALERTLDDVTLQGEIEGISFDKENESMLISYNRGARIVLGMPSGFYEGYDSEIHEIYEYEID